MRLVGIINGSITFADRPTFFGEPFDLVATVETPGVSNWTNLSAATSSAAGQNLPAAPTANWQNVTGPGAGNWANV